MNLTKSGKVLVFQTFAVSKIIPHLTSRPINQNLDILKEHCQQ